MKTVGKELRPSGGSRVASPSTRAIGNAAARLYRRAGSRDLDPEIPVPTRTCSRMASASHPSATTTLSDGGPTIAK